MSLSTEETAIDVTSHPADVSRLASADVLDWREILSHKTVLGQGTLPPSSPKGSTLFVTNVAPLYLRSDTQKTVISHLAELFSQWHGDLLFEVVLTIPYFAATKLVVAFAPTNISLVNMSAATMAGLHNSVILNPANNYSVTLRVPFISVTNWCPTAAGVGEIGCKLLEPIVSSLELNQGLPWTLLVSADPDSFRFRYIIPPIIEGSGEEPVHNVPTLGDNVISISMSTTAGKVEGQRAVTRWPLVQQTPSSLALQYESMMLVPRSRVEFVMQKVRGQFPTGEYPADVIANMFDVSAFTYDRVQPFSPPNPYAVFPYLTQPFRLQRTTVYNVVGADAPVYIWSDPSTCKLWFQVPSSADIPIGTIMYFVMIPKTRPLPTISICDYEGHVTNLGVKFFRFKSDVIIRDNSGVVQCAMAVWKPSNVHVDRILAALKQIDQCPGEITHMALYTTMPPDLAATFTDWLVTADNTSPPAQALSYSISFSPNQASLAYNAGRFSESQKARGVIWRLFKLFKGDETKWWAWLVKGLDVIVDALIGAFLGRADSPYVVPIGASSGFRVQAVGAYDPKLVTKSDPVPLEYIPRRETRSLMDIQLRETTHRLFRSRSKSASGSQGDAASRPVSLSPHASRVHSRSHQAKHPSPKKHRFRLQAS
uniref:Putative capsid protein n=1 Tax=Calhevirus 3 TaxID=2219047 RepID=A0A2Z4BRV2_9VIRU|nr:MAG: putative capsid protein [Calhevirus 3]